MPPGHRFPSPSRSPRAARAPGTGCAVPTAVRSPPPPPPGPRALAALAADPVEVVEVAHHPLVQRARRVHVRRLAPVLAGVRLRAVHLDAAAGLAGMPWRRWIGGQVHHDPARLDRHLDAGQAGAAVRSRRLDELDVAARAERGLRGAHHVGRGRHAAHDDVLRVRMEVDDRLPAVARRRTDRVLGADADRELARVRVVEQAHLVAGRGVDDPVVEGERLVAGTRPGRELRLRDGRRVLAAGAGAGSRAAPRGARLPGRGRPGSRPGRPRWWPGRRRVVRCRRRSDRRCRRSRPQCGRSPGAAPRPSPPPRPRPSRRCRPARQLAPAVGHPDARRPGAASPPRRWAAAGAGRDPGPGPR